MRLAWVPLVLVSCGGRVAVPDAMDAAVDHDVTEAIPDAVPDAPTTPPCGTDLVGPEWALVTDVSAPAISPSKNKQYLYVAPNQHWYLSPATTLTWTWSAYQALDGAYTFCTGTLLDAFMCVSNEAGGFGVGCSNGPGDTFKTLPIYSATPSAGQCEVCQDRPEPATLLAMSQSGFPIRYDLEGRRGQMFPVLTADQIARVRPFGREQSFEAGALVWEQGDAAPFYVVLEGQLEVVHPYGPTEHPVTIHQPGEFTGEMSMLFARRGLVRARAKGPLRMLRVEVPRLQSLVQTDSELSEIVMRAFILRRMALLSEGWGDALVVGSRDSAATLRLQAFLVRNGQPYHYLDVDRDPDVQAMLDHFHVGVQDIPIVICRGERVLKHPTDAEVADCLGLNPSIEPKRVFDVIVCGAGPGGLAAAVYAASEGLDVMIVEAGAPGGQAGSSSRIENYLGFPTGISGQALTARGLAQAEKFGAQLTIARGAAKLFCDETPLRIELEGGESMRARAVVIATGAQYRKLDVPDLARFESNGVYYAATNVEAQRCGVEEVVVVGGGNSAGQAATFLSRNAAHVHMLIRGPTLAESMSRYLIRRIEDTPNITLHKRTRVIAMRGKDHLDEITWRDDEAKTETTRSIRHVFSMAGAVPNTQWLQGCVSLDDKGFVLTGADLMKDWRFPRPPMLFETSQSRVFAIGDVRSSSVKRVASAVGEGSVCIQLVHRALAG